MKQLENFGGEKMPSIINDPFIRVHVTSISVRWYRDHSIHAKGEVVFQNGNTKGEQYFEGVTFDEVVLKMKAMIENLEK